MPSVRFCDSSPGYCCPFRSSQFPFFCLQFFCLMSFCSSHHTDLLFLGQSVCPHSPPRVPLFHPPPLHFQQIPIAQTRLNCFLDRSIPLHHRDDVTPLLILYDAFERHSQTV